MLARLLRLAQHTQEWRRLYRGFHIVGGAINCVIIHCISGGTRKSGCPCRFFSNFILINAYISLSNHLG